MARMDAAAALARWHAVVESRDPAGLPGLIAEDAVFRSQRSTRRRSAATPSSAT